MANQIEFLQKLKQSNAGQIRSLTDQISTLPAQKAQFIVTLDERLARFQLSKAELEAQQITIEAILAVLTAPTPS